MKLKVAAKLTGRKKSNPINMISNIKQGVSRWKQYATSKRQGKTQGKYVVVILFLLLLL